LTTRISIASAKAARRRADVVDENVNVAVVASPMARRSPPPSPSVASPNGATENGFSSPSPPPPHTAFLPDNLQRRRRRRQRLQRHLSDRSVPAARNLPTLLEPPVSPHPAEVPPPLLPATIQTAAAHGFVAGQLITNTSIGVSGYNGTFAVATVPMPRISLSHAQPEDSPLRVVAPLRGAGRAGMHTATVPQVLA